MVTMGRVCESRVSQSPSVKTRGGHLVIAGFDLHLPNVLAFLGPVNYIVLRLKLMSLALNV